MTCPICENHAIEIDMHADGYSGNLLECANCDALWLNVFGEITLVTNKAV